MRCHLRKKVCVCCSLFVLLHALTSPVSPSICRQHRNNASLSSTTTTATATETEGCAKQNALSNQITLAKQSAKSRADSASTFHPNPTLESESTAISSGLLQHNVTTFDFSRLASYTKHTFHYHQDIAQSKRASTLPYSASGPAHLPRDAEL